MVVISSMGANLTYALYTDYDNNNFSMSGDGDHAGCRSEGSIRELSVLLAVAIGDRRRVGQTDLRITLT